MKLHSACDRYLKSPKAEIVFKNVLLKMNKRKAERPNEGK